MRRFDWGRSRAVLTTGSDDGGIDIAHAAVDRHVLEGRGDRVALRCVGAEGTTRTVSYVAKKSR